MLEDDVY